MLSPHVPRGFLRQYSWSSTLKLHLWMYISLNIGPFWVSVATLQTQCSRGYRRGRTHDLPLVACTLSTWHHDIFYVICVLFAYICVARAQICLIRRHCMPRHQCHVGSHEQLMEMLLPLGPLPRLAGEKGMKGIFYEKNTFCFRFNTYMLIKNIMWCIFSNYIWI